MDRAAKLQEIRERQNRWLRERQAEMDRQTVVAELQQQHHPHGGRGAGQGSAAPAGGQHHRGGAPASSGGPAAAHGGYTPHATGSGPGSGPGPGLGPGIGAGGMVASMGGALPSGLGGGLGGGVKPEEVIDRLTERITDRLRNELKVELQRESESLAAHQDALDTFLVHELESQNTCPVCYELMVPPDHAPMMLFPCGHSFCNRCLVHHIDRNKKTQCPICRKRIESRAPNYSLQQLIQQVVAKKDSVGRPGARSPGGPGGRGAAAGGGGAGADGGGGLGHGGATGGGVDSIRRQYERAATRMRVLRNELADTAAEEAEVGTRVVAASVVMEHFKEEEAQVLKRLAAVQAELQLVREQMGDQGAKLGELQRAAEGVRQRRELLQATLGPLEAEVEKLEVLMAGVAEMHGQG